MGNRPSAYNKYDLNVRNTLDIINRTIVNNSTTTVLQSENVNYLKLTVRNSTIGGNLNVTQTIDTNQEADGKISSQVLDSLASSVLTDLKNSLDQSAKATAGFLATGEADTANISKIKNALDQSVKSTFESTNYSSILSTTINKNTNELIMENVVVATDVNISQGIVCRAIANNVINQIIDKTNTILQNNNLDLTVKQTATSENKGFNTAMSAFSAISSSLVLMFIIFLIFVYIRARSKK